MLIIALVYAALAIIILALYTALLVSLIGIYAATQAPEYAGRLTRWLGYGKERHETQNKR